MFHSWSGSHRASRKMIGTILAYRKSRADQLQEVEKWDNTLDSRQSV